MESLVDLQEIRLDEDCSEFISSLRNGFRESSSAYRQKITTEERLWSLNIEKNWLPFFQRLQLNFGNSQRGIVVASEGGILPIRYDGS